MFQRNHEEAGHAAAPNAVEIRSVEQIADIGDGLRNKSGIKRQIFIVSIEIRNREGAEIGGKADGFDEKGEKEKQGDEF
jgi:hypothetical protein